MTFARVVHRLRPGRWCPRWIGQITASDRFLLMLEGLDDGGVHLVKGR
jgi:hypothetical protein